MTRAIPRMQKDWKAAHFKRDNPNGLIIHHIIMHPPNGEPNWERYIASGTNVQIAKKQALLREEALEEAIKAPSRDRASGEGIRHDDQCAGFQAR